MNRKLKYLLLFSMIFFTFNIISYNSINKFDNEKIKENIATANKKKIDIQDSNNIDEIKENIEKQKEILNQVDDTTVTSIESDNENIGTDTTNSSLDIDEKVIENSDITMDMTSKTLKIGTIIIPEINVNMPVFQGDNKNTDNMLSGAITNKKNQNLGSGNYVLSSHFVIEGDTLFTNIYRLKKGDEIFIKTNKYQYTYTVYNNFDVNYKESWILKDIENYNILTLYSCSKSDTENKRTVIRAVLTNIK